MLVISSWSAPTRDERQGMGMAEQSDAGTAATHLIGAGDPDYWRGAIAWTDERAPLRQQWRIRPELTPTTKSEAFIRRSRMPGAVRCCLVTDADRVRLPVWCGDDGLGLLDVLVDGARHDRITLSAGDQVVEIGLPRPEAAARVEFWLPQSCECAVGDLAAFGASICQPAPPPTFRWVAYGSSITQCRGDEGPSDIWPSRVARAAGWDLHTTGMGGECHLDYAVSATIADLPADLITLCIGANIWGGPTFNDRSLVSQLLGFIAALRVRHPDTPIVVSGPIRAPEYEDAPNAVGLTLSQIRELVLEAVRFGRELGDDRLAAVDALTFLTADETGWLFDGLHPHPDAYPVMAERIGAAYAAALADFGVTTSRR
jgi:lysophospholipase L1-like esterase